MLSILALILRFIKKHESKCIEITDPFTGNIERYYYKR